MKFTYFIKGFITFWTIGEKHKVYAFAGSYFSSDDLSQKLKDNDVLSLIGGRIKMDCPLPEQIGMKSFYRMRDTLVTEVSVSGDLVLIEIEKAFDIKFIPFNYWDERK